MVELCGFIWRTNLESLVQSESSLSTGKKNNINVPFAFSS